ncbi:MAG: hypothetical protein HGA50_17555, partial [Deltaproteobacteria bacterium]|nr:hypothetical protein [Deltaproteobacteria bacterium]
MKGPIQVVRSGKVSGLVNLGPIHEWSEGSSSVVIDRVSFNGNKGAVLCYCNPPVHQVGNPALDAYLQGLDKVFQEKVQVKFLLLY